MRCVLLIVGLATTACDRPRCANSPCLERTSALIGRNDSTPLGVTAAQLIASSEGHFVGTVTWVARDGVSMSASGTHELQMDLVCGDGGARLRDFPFELEVDCTAHFLTGDGAFNDSLAATLSQTGDGSPVVLDPARLSARVDPSSLLGSFRVASSDPSYSSAVTLSLSYGDASSVGGQVIFEKTRAQGDVVSYASTSIGSITALREP